MQVIQSIRGVLPKEFTVGSTANSCTFFEEINRDRYFHAPENYQH